jgi:hypothetical protein
VRPPSPLASTAAGLAAAVVLAAAPPLAADGVAILGLDGVDLGRWSGRGDLAGDDPHCVAVARRRGPPRFHLAAIGDGPAGRFELRNGATALPFTARYDDGTGPRTLEPGRTLAHLKGHPDTPGLQRCRRGDRGARNRIEIRVSERDLARVTAGRFHGRLHLMVLAE